MRGVLLCALIALAAPAWAVNWRSVPSPADYQAMIDLDSVKPQRNFASFTLRRAYNDGHSDAAGNEFFSTRLIIIADCIAGTAVTAATQYYGADRKLVHREVQNKIAKSEFTAPDPGSDIAEALKLACIRLAEGSKGDTSPPKKTEPAQAAPTKPFPRSSSGSGIVVSRDGHVLTNQHVVRECSAYEVFDDSNRKMTAALQAVDVAKDLALLTVKEPFPSVASLRKDVAPKLGEAVTVVGYPLVGVLGTRPTVGFGHVSSTIGVRGNPSQMQISVPVQRGNSGGPVLDQAGNVIGVVVSKLDALKIAQRIGDLPQNVNFAIRGEAVRTFLEAQNVEFTASEAAAKLENTEIASRGAAVTVRVRCIREAATPANAQH